MNPRLNPAIMIRLSGSSLAFRQSCMVGNNRTAGRPAGALSKAVRYLLNQGEDLATYLHHGEVEIDNNSIERDVPRQGIPETWCD